MMPARRRALAIIVAVLIGTAVAVAVIGRDNRVFPPRSPTARPSLLLLSSLPLVFGEQFSLQNSGSPALSALEPRYRVIPIAVTDAKSLDRGRLLLMAHPAAQPPEDLVALDDWIRRGGRLLLLADPLLEWPSSRPLGDPLRPSPMFADTGLLVHWGLRLDAPESRGRARRQLAGYDVVTDSAGSLAGACDISADALVAHCRIGRGRVTVIADADFLDSKRLGPDAGHNLDALLGELDALERP